MSDRQKRQAQQERDELADEMVNSSSGKSVLHHRHTMHKTCFRLTLRGYTDVSFTNTVYVYVCVSVCVCVCVCVCVFECVCVNVCIND